MSNTSLLGSFGGQGDSSLMFRNVLINGCFRVWQRGTSQTTAGYGSADRWVFGHSGSSRTASRQTFTVGQTDVPGNPTYFVRNVVTSVAGNSNYTLMRQNIEYVSTLAGQTVTVSFWAKADGAKPISIEFTQSFGTGGSPVVTGTGTKITLSTSWAYYSIVVNLPSISGKTIGPDDYLQMNIWLEAGSDFNARTNSLGQQSGTFDFSNFQLEAGPTATPFERRPIGVETALCQRYTVVYGGKNAYEPIGLSFGASTTTAFTMIHLPVQLRAVPGVTSTGSFRFDDRAASYPITSIALHPSGFFIGDKTIQLFCSVASGLTTKSMYLMEAANDNNARLILSAEL